MPVPISRREASSALRPPVRSSTTALVQVPIGMSVRRGCRAWPSQVPLTASFSFPGPSELRTALPIRFAGGSSASAFPICSTTSCRAGLLGRGGADPLGSGDTGHPPRSGPRFAYPRRRSANRAPGGASSLGFPAMATAAPSLTLHALPPSHPCLTAEIALERKGLEFDRVYLSAGEHNQRMEEIYGS